MKNVVLLYLVEASLYLIAFAFAYKLLLARLTHFQWMRVYLMVSVAFSLSAPLFSVPAVWAAWLLPQESGWQPTSFSLFSSQDWLASSLGSAGTPTNATENGSFLFIWILLGIYGIGLLYKTWLLGCHLRNIQRLIMRHPKQREGAYWLVKLPQRGSAFSFLHYVFLNPDSTHLTPHELRQVKAHERIHVQQRHTWDRLLFEVAHCILWFNPLMRYLKNQLQEVQEYLADHAVAGEDGKQKDYAHLLLKLATESRPISLVTGFSDKQIIRRIQLLNQPRSSPRKKVIFASVIPMVACCFLLSACLEESSTDAQSGNAFPEAADTQGANQRAVKIGEITWQGNTVYDDETLTHTLGLQPGDPYDSVIFYQRFQYNPDRPDVSTLYMDQGYLFFSVNITIQEVGEETVDLTMDIYEGQVMKIGQLLIQGNRKVPREEIEAQIPIKSGQLFNRSQLIASQRAIAEMGYFDPEQVSINPIPDPERGTVDIEFILIPRTTSQ